MPCYDDRCDTRPDYHDEYVQERLAKELAQAIACALLSALEDVSEGMTLLDDINYEEAGFKRIQLERWWKRHKKLDCERREREKARKVAARKAAEEKAKAAKARDEALAKLTPADRKALGL